MDRNAIRYLKTWKTRQSRKPLIIRGARQVGKSYLVRQFAEQEFKNLVEVNLEYNKDLLPYFEKQDPREIVRLLSLHFNCPIVEGETLLFFDEVQAAPDILSRLRYFYELMPGIHVVAAGSLLDFILEEHTFSMPVGRIEFYHLGPLTFMEFLRASGDESAAGFLETYSIGQEFPGPLHKKLNDLFRQYLVVGGMPESILTFIESGSYLETDRVKQSILSTYPDDFSKYGQRVNHSLLETVFKALPQLPGTMVKYTRISREFRPGAIARALHLLALARVCSPVYHSTCEGIPLAAKVNKKKMKVLYLDVGLLTSACGLSMLSMEKAPDVLLVNNGSVAEQFIGQHLLYRQLPYREPELHFWSREKPSSNAEIDFAIAVDNTIAGIEVKSGTTGSLKSLNQFMVERKYPVAVRFNLGPPSLCNAAGRMPAGDPYDYTLVSLPCYLVEQTDRLFKEAIK
ncbi:MAG: AAA family ATPase [Chitinispirillaceae bacterium]|nr:AAA family ATPase [Chitinispirillaceae bacterium]